MEPLVQEFLSNLIDLCLRRLNRFPVSVRGKLSSWAEKLRNGFRESRLAHAIASALEKLRTEAKELAEALIAEIEAVVELQNYALHGPKSTTLPTPENGSKESAARAETRALKASATLLGSLREAVWYLPDWAKGLLKVGEEIIEIFSPAR